MQYYKRSNGSYWEMIDARMKKHGSCEIPFHTVTHREHGVIPGCVPAHDIWVFAEDPARDPDRLYMTIKNPSKPYRPAY